MERIAASDHALVTAALNQLILRVGAPSSQPPPSLAELAGYVGLSEFHFQRLFHQWAGVTPKTVLQLLTLQAARGALAEPGALFDHTRALGLSGPSRLHDLFVRLEAMTPGEYQRQGRGLTLRWAVLPTALGPACFASTDRGICGISFVDNEAEAEAELGARWPGAERVNDPDSLRPSAELLDARLRGQPVGPLSVLLKGTPFQVKVWEALLRLPEGATVSYGAIAAELGSPGSSRAVGSAVGANPIAVLIPCHRVIRQSGIIGDYRWGAGRKRTLLALEHARRAGGAPESPPGR